MNTRLVTMLQNGVIPNRGGVWIDCYNQSVNEDVAGTIISGIQSKNHYFVTEMKKQVVLGWTRDKRGKVINRHVVKIANAVTSAKRDNTQNYVAVGERLMEKRKLKIRKLTERECFRLMDVPDEVITKIQQHGVPRTWQAKLAGNSIVVNVLYCLFDRMFVHTQPIGQLQLF